MKMNIIPIVLILCSVACGQSSPDQDSALPSPETKPNEHSTATLEKKEACEYVEDKAIAEIMGWDASSIKEEQMMSLKDRDVTVCSYLHEDDMLMVRLAWKSAKSEENKVLEKNFQKFLNEAEKDLSYQEVGTTSNSQTIFGTGKGRGGQMQYILRKRIGNTVDIQIERTSMENNPEGFSEKLRALLASIES